MAVDGFVEEELGELLGEGAAEEAEDALLAGGQAHGDAGEPAAGDGQVAGEDVFELGCVEG